MVRKVNGYMSRLFDFLNRLAMNNNREWFHQNKAEFDELRTLWLNDVQRLINLMAEYDESLKSVDAKDCVYRIYRDIRFSPNKLPYKTYFSTVVAQGGRKTLKKFLCDKKIPARIGHGLPIVAKGSEVYAVIGVEIADGVKVTEKTARRVWLYAAPRPQV